MSDAFRLALARGTDPHDEIRHLAFQLRNAQASLADSQAREREAEASNRKLRDEVYALRRKLQDLSTRRST